MTTVLPALHEGHAPIFLHQAFDDAIHAYEEWAPDLAEPEVEFDGRAVGISAVFGRMRDCTDLLPTRTLETVRAVTQEDGALSDQQVTYADAATLMRTLFVERLRA
ncbi:hypothetical protein ACFOEZ_17935 [Tianweitania populi]|uniref:Uncharacterized protein n=1 Tax=Tianweitania populi TaxID=1607949 RepID=A0A8J3GLU6_9HYPH|nr:hypothetical protein [Tianweitania populi]GHD14008.1 hypothetical protein GCM10016234_19010 [Tianweitania populi]